MRSIHWLVRVAVLAVLMLPVAASAAHKFSLLTGVWGANRGPIVDIPAFGDAACTGLTWGTQQTGLPAPTTTMLPLSMTGQVAFPRGCVPASATSVDASGSSPAQFTVPPNAFSQPAPGGTGNNLIGFDPTVVQLNTNISFMFPATTPISPGGTMAGPLAPWRVFKQDAHQTQTGRAGPDFVWCPGNPACTVINQGGATQPIIIKYKAKPNAFGGTMAMILNGGGSTSVIVGTTAGLPIIAHLTFGGAGTMSQHLGRGYAAYDTVMLGSAPAHVGYMTNGTRITMTGTYGMSVFTIPGDTNANWGFPHTTGTVLVRNTGPGPFGTPSNETFTAMGTDSRTRFGAGNITLVSGGASNRVQSGQDFSSLDIVQLTFAPEPAALLQLASALVGLGGLVWWRARSRR